MCCVCVLGLTRESPSMVCVGHSGERVAAAGWLESSTPSLNQAYVHGGLPRSDTEHVKRRLSSPSSQGKPGSDCTVGTDGGPVIRMFVICSEEQAKITYH